MSTTKQNVLNYDGLKRFYQGLLNKFVPQEEGKGLSTNDYTATDKSKVALIDNKVDKVQGKQLSTNDYTTAEKDKLASLNNAEAITPEQIAAVCGMTVYNARRAVL